MKISYNILWIDDEPMTSDIKRIESYLDSLGFVPNVEKLSSIKSESETDFSKYNLIILDYHLNNRETTDCILKKIKEKSYYSEVIFYSSKGNFGDYIKENLDKFEGVFWCGDRGNILYMKITSVIDLTLKKFQDLNNLRGLVMAETADLESMKEEVIRKYDKSSCSKKEKIKSKIIRDLKSKSSEYSACLDKMDKNTSFKEILDKLRPDLFRKSMIVHKINHRDKPIADFEHEKFNEEIITKRNLLAHVKEKKDEDGQIILESAIGKSKFVFSQDHARKIRKDISKYRNELQKIINSF